MVTYLYPTGAPRFLGNTSFKHFHVTVAGTDIASLKYIYNSLNQNMVKFQQVLMLQIAKKKKKKNWSFLTKNLNICDKVLAPVWQGFHKQNNFNYILIMINASHQINSWTSLNDA